MKFKKRYFLLLIVSAISTACYADLTADPDAIPYCKDSPAPTSDEDTLLQTMVMHFAAANDCEIGNNCLLKSQVGPDHLAQFSITWKAQCGPVVNGVYQIGNEGRHSLFACQQTMGTSITCCWPVGLELAGKFVTCTPYKANKKSNKS
jgi:hypothetical protein